MKNEKEKKRSNPLDKAKELAQTFSDKLKHKKATRERTRGRIKSDRVGLAEGPNTLANGGKVCK